MEQAILTTKTQKINISEVLEYFCNVFNVTKEQIISKKRNAEITRARQYIVYFLRKFCSMNIVEIGLIVNQNYTTINYSVNQIQDLMKIYPAERQHLELAKQHFNIQ